MHRNILIIFIILIIVFALLYKKSMTGGAEQKKFQRKDFKILISYNGHNIENEEEMSMESTKAPPKVTYIAPDGLYTLTMIDPDVYREYNLSYLHWMVCNIKLVNGKVVDSDTIVKYQGPSPPSGEHHYYFHLIRQKKEKEINVKITDRASFDFYRFVKQNHLQIRCSKVFICSADSAKK